MTAHRSKSRGIPPDPPLAKLGNRFESLRALKSAAAAVAHADTSSSLGLALDEAASALQGLFVLEDDLRGAALPELLAYLVEKEWPIDEDAPEAAEGLLEFKGWEEYARPRIRSDLRRDVVEALKAVLGCIEAGLR